MNDQPLNHVQLTPYQSEAIVHLLEKLTFDDIQRRVSPLYDPYEVQSALTTLRCNL